MTDNDNNDFKQFSEQYLKSCKEQISALANNPSMLEKALEPFMKMQQQYLNNPESMNLLTENAGSSNKTESVGEHDDGINVTLQKILHRVQGIRKKILPQIMEKLEAIDRKIINIENKLGISDQDGMIDNDQEHNIQKR